jgi:hypothetical protein
MWLLQALQLIITQPRKLSHWRTGILNVIPELENIENN